MKFNPAYKPNRENLSAATAALMDRAFYSRRDKGFNVQFDNEGDLDEWSFADDASKNKFVARLCRNGTAYAISA